MRFLRLSSAFVPAAPAPPTAAWHRPGGGPSHRPSRRPAPAVSVAAASRRQPRMAEAGGPGGGSSRGSGGGVRKTPAQLFADTQLYVRSQGQAAGAPWLAVPCRSVRVGPILLRAFLPDWSSFF